MKIELNGELIEIYFAAGYAKVDRKTANNWVSNQMLNFSVYRGNQRSIRVMNEADARLNHGSIIYVNSTGRVDIVKIGVHYYVATET